MIRVRTVLTCITVIAMLGVGPALANGAEVTWTLSYDASTNLVTFTFDNTTQQILLPTADPGEAYIRVTATRPSGEDGRSQDVIRIRGRVLADGAVLSGQTAMNWTGDGAAGMWPVLQTEVISPTTAYVEKATWGQLKNMFNK